MMRPIRALTIVIVVTGLLSACSNGPQVPPTNALVNAAVNTIQTLKARKDLPQFAKHLKGAHGVAIFPSVYKVGFYVGVEGGNGVMLSKDAQGNWGYPAFYVLASGSLGIQFGAQRAEAVLIMRSPGAVQAVVKHQGKFGADVGLAVAHIGTGVEASITSNLGADIIAFTDAKGLFGGVSLEGSGMIRRKDYNAQYYGGTAGATPQSILINHAHRNAQANGLRNVLVVR